MYEGKDTEGNLWGGEEGLLRKKIGRNLQDIRKERGVRQRDLAKALGVSVNTISNYETGHSMYTIEMLLLLASLLKTTPGRLLNGAYPQGEEGEALGQLLRGYLHEELRKELKRDLHRGKRTQRKEA